MDIDTLIQNEQTTKKELRPRPREVVTASTENPSAGQHPRDLFNLYELLLLTFSQMKLS